MRRFITSGPGLPSWSSPISHAVVVNDTCYLSGQLSLDAEGRYVPGTPAQEAQLAFRNLFSALAAAGFEPADLVFIDIAFVDLRGVPEVNGVYESLFPPGQRPARTIYQAAALPFGGKVKVTAVAVRDRAAPLAG
ncbi:RidA family protein [Aquabacterium sp. A7-Y]|uniref:RidA family protein n=1 Tax=Aquabacterium sp. A7-Y TaxID=1349605 RepID=UPI00223DED9E|nr:RidA family protein [Aquabacterium sp. A7-Y]MCW7538086.1 RidA family protein [Aquabacterium sp. A7-Y]